MPRCPLPLAGALLLLAACAPLAGGPPDAAPVAPPTLVPLGPVLAAGDALAAAPPQAGSLPARADALAGRAEALAAGPAGPTAEDRARLDALEARADALRAGESPAASLGGAAGGGSGPAASLP